ncbi:hypothetical protein [Streptomyces griseosporeus]|uniref:hypothetical protein n=1 Tax=Streptomyces griseosporeus TaxID=1910 RepID=UPI0007184F31|nr:hypothetical protein SHL15_6678 [Streptomyces hygroscopicus subsp. limoneus]
MTQLSLTHLASSREWHDYWKEFVPVEQREQRRGAHIADVVTACGCVVEVQHQSMSPTKIGGRELDHGYMVWIWDVREAYVLRNLGITGFNRGFTTFRWKNHRRNLRACRRPVFLDLGYLRGTTMRTVIKVEKLEKDGRGTGHLITHHAMRMWMAAGISYRPLPALPDGVELGEGACQTSTTGL